MNDNYILSMKQIFKSFPGVKALNNVDFFVKAGEVHSLMGENGAGKSTLIKILTGVYQYDSGEIIYNGNKVRFNNTLDAQKAGISTIYQELNMIPYLSVGENIFLGRYPRHNRTIDWTALYRDAQILLDEMDIKADAKRSICEYGTAIQQMVLITRAINLNCKLIVMDEPTSSLDTKEVKHLFSLIENLKKRGISVVFISHRLDEVYAISDRITILKDGTSVGTYMANELTQYELISKMIGRDIENSFEHKRVFDAEQKEYIVEIKDIVSLPMVRKVNIKIKSGEIVGLAGLLGSGRTETAKVLFGYDQPDNGEIFIQGQKVHLKSPNQAIAKGLAFCTENRREEGIIPNMSVKDNITLACLPQLSKFGFIQKKEQDKLVEEYIKNLGIKTPSSTQKIKNLSGGNQQKVILARWMATKPKVIILDEPTRGIDVGAKREVEVLVRKLADNGISVLYISSEISELVRNCDKVYILRDGEVVGEVTDEDINENKLMYIIANKSI
jgi:ABC-type sugar transport system, ATPase component